MKKSEEKLKKPDAPARRPAGKRILPPPTPRPIPLDHPAKALFNTGLAQNEKNYPPAKASATSLSSDAHLETVGYQKHDEITNENILSSSFRGIPASIPASIPNEDKFIEKKDQDNPKTKSANENKSVAPKHSLNRREEDASEQIAPLDATHTASEKNVYSILYRETVSKNARERHFGPVEIMKKTGIKSRNTVHLALYGLIKKLSIEVIAKSTGNPLGPRYRIYKPKEIEQRRRDAGIQIDPQTKKILPVEVEEEGGEKDVTIPAGIPDGIPAGIPTYYPKIWDSTIPNFGIPTIPKFGIVIKSKENIGEVESLNQSSSSKLEGAEPTDDEAKDASINLYLNQIREVYERVTLNTFTPQDAATAIKARDIPATIWGIAICYCVDRAPNHKFNHLAYVAEEARNHYQEMGSMPKSDLEAILRHGMRIIERARTTNAWNPAPP